jgi:hypothetical protein
MIMYGVAYGVDIWQSRLIRARGFSSLLRKEKLLHSEPVQPNSTSKTVECQLGVCST